MDLTKGFLDFIRQEKLCNMDSRVLLAVSGGKDSMLMLELFRGAGIDIGVAHCNFQLRDAASDADETLLYEQAKSHGVPFYSTRFDTIKFAETKQISIQMAARTLRYEWLEQIRSSQGYDLIAVAHHQNDSIETVLLNLVRGTGLAGLRGILPKRGHIIRPLLYLTGDQVNTLVKRLQVPYRDDQSNFSTKYARNLVRLEVVPKLKMLNPSIEETFSENIAIFNDTYQLLQTYVEEIRTKLWTLDERGRCTIQSEDLTDTFKKPGILYEILKPFSFSLSTIRDILNSLNEIPGKKFYSPTHQLHLDRHHLFIQPRSNHYLSITRIAAQDEYSEWEGFRFRKAHTSDTSLHRDRNMLQVDEAKIEFPLQIRAWRIGDTIPPLGMKGRKKKISDLFVSLKIPVYEKNNIPILVNGNGDILWVVPYCLNENYKISAKTKKVLTLALI